MHTHWVFKLSSFIGVWLRDWNNGPPCSWDHMNNELKTIFQRSGWAATWASCVDPPQTVSPVSPVQRSTGLGVSCLRQKTNITGQPEGVQALKQGEMASSVLNRTAELDEGRESSSNWPVATWLQNRVQGNVLGACCLTSKVQMAWSQRRRSKSHSSDLLDREAHRSQSLVNPNLPLGSNTDYLPSAVNPSCL